MSPSITLRPITPDDEAFLYRLYASTRAEELAMVEWDEPQKEAFLWQQFSAQHTYYQAHYYDTSFQVILWAGESVGRLYLARWQDEHRIVDIALLPVYRRQGIGSALLAEIIAEAEGKSLPVRIHVERENPALQLYERLGFHLLEDKGVYLFLERPPTLQAKQSHVGGTTQQ